MRLAIIEDDHLYSYGLDGCGPYCYGLCGYGLYSYGLYSYGVHRYDLYSYGPYDYGHVYPKSTCAAGASLPSSSFL